MFLVRDLVHQDVVCMQYFVIKGENQRNRGVALRHSIIFIVPNRHRKFTKLKNI